jgi:hypothetical protein
MVNRMELIISKEILQLLWKLKVHYHVRRSPDLHCNLSHVNHGQKIALNCETVSIFFVFLPLKFVPFISKFRAC